MQQNKVYFIGGASGSGKTTVIPALQQLLGDNFTLYDFDDIGVPSGADKKLRTARIKENCWEGMT